MVHYIAGSFSFSSTVLSVAMSTKAEYCILLLARRDMEDTSDGILLGARSSLLLK